MVYLNKMASENSHRFVNKAFRRYDPPTSQPQDPWKRKLLTLLNQQFRLPPKLRKRQIRRKKHTLFIESK